MEKLKYKLRVRLFREELVFGPGVAALMEGVSRTGSLSEACREMGMAYSKGWRITRRAEDDLGFALMTGSRGGRNGGRMTLTPEGADLLRRYRRFETRLNQEAARIYVEEFEAE